MSAAKSQMQICCTYPLYQLNSQCWHDNRRN